MVGRAALGVLAAGLAVAAAREVTIKNVNPNTGVVQSAHSVQYGNGIWCAYNAEQIYWTKTPNVESSWVSFYPDFEQPGVMKFGNGKFIYANDQGVYTSSDCRSWSQGSKLPQPVSDVSPGKVNGRNAIAVVLTDGSVGYTSDNGANWRATRLASNYNNSQDCGFSTVAWNKWHNQFLFLSRGTPTNPCMMVGSSDLERPHYFPTAYPPFPTSYMTITAITQHHIFMSEFSQGQLSHFVNRATNDGKYEEWDPVQLVDTHGPVQVAADPKNDTLVVGVGVSGLCPWDSQQRDQWFGNVWTSQYSGDYNWQQTHSKAGLTAIAAADGIFVGVGCQGTVMTSPNGIHWKRAVTPSGISFGLGTEMVGFRYMYGGNSQPGCLIWGDTPFTTGVQHYFFSKTCAQPWAESSPALPNNQWKPYSTTFFKGKFYITTLQDQALYVSDTLDGPYTATQINANRPGYLLQQYDLTVTPWGLVGAASMTNKTTGADRCAFSFVSTDGKTAQTKWNCGYNSWGLSYIMYNKGLNKVFSYGNQVGTVFYTHNGLDWTASHAPQSMFALCNGPDGHLYGLDFRVNSVYKSTDGVNYNIISGSTSPFGTDSFQFMYLKNAGTKLISYAGDARGSHVWITPDYGLSWEVLYFFPQQLMDGFWDHHTNMFVVSTVDGGVYKIPVHQN